MARKFTGSKHFESPLGFCCCGRLSPEKVSSLLMAALLVPTPKTCSRAGKMQRTTRISKGPRQILWRSSSVWPSPSFYSSDAPKINVLNWRTNSCNNECVSCVLSQTQLGCWAQVLSDGSAEEPYPRGKKTAGVADFTLSPSVCRIAKAILARSSPFYTSYCIQYRVSGVTWPKIQLVDINITQPISRSKQ